MTMRPLLGWYLLAGLSLSLSLPAAGQAVTADSIITAVDALARHAVAEDITPALGVAIVLDGRVIMARGYGWRDASAGLEVDDQTLWYIASTSKSFLGMALSLLATDRRLDFGQPVTTWLPEARWHPSVRADTIPLSAWLAHTHGVDPFPLENVTAYSGAVPEALWPELLRYDAASSVVGISYSNLGYTVGAMVIDQLHPAGWRDLEQYRLFEPLGMKDTYARMSEVDPERIAKSHVIGPDGRFVTQPWLKADATMSAAGGHLATLRDLARWAMVQMDSGRIDGHQVLPQLAVARSQALLARYPAPERFTRFVREGWAAGWDIGSFEGERMVSRFGNYQGTRSHLSFLPGRRVGVVAMATASGGDPLTDLVAEFVYDLTAGRADAWERADRALRAAADGAATARRVAPAVAASLQRLQELGPPGGWAAYAGSFSHPAVGQVHLTNDADGLLLTWGVLRTRLLSVSPTRAQFRMADLPVSFAAERTPDGRATALCLGDLRLPRDSLPP